MESLLLQFFPRSPIPVSDSHHDPPSGHLIPDSSDSSAWMGAQQDGNTARKSATQQVLLLWVARYLQTGGFINIKLVRFSSQSHY